MSDAHHHHRQQPAYTLSKTGPGAKLVSGEKPDKWCGRTHPGCHFRVVYVNIKRLRRGGYVERPWRKQERTTRPTAWDYNGPNVLIVQAGPNKGMMHQSLAVLPHIFKGCAVQHLLVKSHPSLVRTSTSLSSLEKRAITPSALA